MPNMKPELGFSSLGYYISRVNPNRNDSIFNDDYMHKDGTWHEVCGEKNFYSTKFEAELALAIYTMPYWEQYEWARKALKNMTGAHGRVNSVHIFSGLPAFSSTSSMKEEWRKAGNNPIVYVLFDSGVREPLVNFKQKLDLHAELRQAIIDKSVERGLEILKELKL